QIAHDEPTVRSIHDQAIELMREQRVEMTVNEEELALNLFPKVSLFISMLSFNLLKNPVIRVASAYC
ncbi:hypothetical protein BYT27DRAFT_7125551, partial [Phlegmacium glaucopus]